MSETEKQPFLSHLEELRKRLIYSAIAVGIGFLASYAFAEKLFKILMLPLNEALPEGGKFIFTSPPEVFFTYLKTAFVAGILLASPVIFYQIWMFIAPGLYQKEKKYVIPFVTFSTLLFLCGSLFGYFVVFPFGFQFFMKFANDYISAFPAVKQYFSFATKLLLAFGLVFELPVVIFFLARMGLVTSDLLKKNRKFAVLVIFTAAAVLTPPDPLTQCLMAIPLLVLYELGIYIAKLAHKKKTPEDKEEKTEGEV